MCFRRLFSWEKINKVINYIFGVKTSSTKQDSFFSLSNNNTTKIVLSLSITDLLLSILVMPFTFYSEINVSVWKLGHKVCVLWLSSDLHLTTTSIFHLCSLAYERYLSVAKPIKFRKKLQQRALILIACGWLLSFAFISRNLFYMAICTTPVFMEGMEREETESNK